MRLSKSTFMDQEQEKKEALKQSVSSWTHYYHKPYKCDWNEAYNKALDRKWRYYEK